MNRELTLATAPRRTSTTWTNTHTTKQDLTAWAYQPIEVAHTVSEYHGAAKATQGEWKDVGGFVAGHLKHGRRRKGHVLTRSMITLDIDNLPNDVDLPAHLQDTLDCAWLAHTTLSHTEEVQRWRVWVWLTRDISAEEYGAVARRIAQDINPGLDWLDHTTFEPERFMYKPSTLQDGDYRVEVSRGKPDLDPDQVLARYADWTDMTTWPGIDTHTAQLTMAATAAGHTGKAEDPRTKPGLIGAFNRAYTIPAAIDTFLGDVYRLGTGGRYTYTQGTSANGLIVYDQGLRAWSNHATDPAAGRNLTAFDLVATHLYGAQDEDAAPGTPINKMPSTLAMLAMVEQDTPTKREHAATTAAMLHEAFQPIDGADAQEPTAGEPTATAAAVDEAPATEWLTQLEVNRNGGFKDTIGNFELIFTHDPHLTHISWNAHAHTLHARDPQALPWKQVGDGWTENDYAQLKTYLARTYEGIYSPTKMTDALLSVASKRAFHPVRDFFATLPEWDGVERLDTLLIDYLGAEDSAYTRTVTRKTLVAAHRRTFHPGCKFDTVTVLQGPQGVGKSTIWAKLAGQWFSDDISITDMRDKTGAEKLQGNLIVEISELAGMRKADNESVKGFISRQADKYRPAYGRVVESRPRSCILVGTTNAREGFLRDTTGNRRWLPIEVTGRGMYTVQDLTEELVQQVWAEARAADLAGEKLYLEGDLLEVALEAQADAVEQDDRVGIVQEYLDHVLPNNWETLPIGARRIYLDGGTLPAEFTTQRGIWDQAGPRQTVSKLEIWTECFGREPDAMRKIDAHEITAIMAQIPGWEDTGKQRRLPTYGKQRLFERTLVRVEK